MKFFYLLNKESLPLTFKDPNGNDFFSLTSSNSYEGICSSELFYCTTEYELVFLKTTINQYEKGHEFTVVDIDYHDLPSVLADKLNIVGTCFGKSFSDFDHKLSEWKSSNKEFVNVALLGGYGSRLSSAIASSSLICEAFRQTTDSGIDFRYDVFAEYTRDPYQLYAHMIFRPSRFLNLPILLKTLDVYDCLFIHDNKNFEFFFSELFTHYSNAFGIKKDIYKSYIWLSEGERNNTDQILSSLSENKPKILINFEPNNDYANKLIEKLHSVSDEYTFYSFHNKNYGELTVHAIESLTKLDYSTVLNSLSLMDLLISDNHDMICNAGSLNVPTLALSETGSYDFYSYFPNTQVFDMSSHIKKEKGLSSILGLVQKFLTISKSNFNQKVVAKEGQINKSVNDSGEIDKSNSSSDVLGDATNGKNTKKKNFLSFFSRS